MPLDLWLKNIKTRTKTTLLFLSQKIEESIQALGEGSDPRVECAARVAGVAIGKPKGTEVNRTPITIRNL